MGKETRAAVGIHQECTDRIAGKDRVGDRFLEDLRYGVVHLTETAEAFFLTDQVISIAGTGLEQILEPEIHLGRGDQALLHGNHPVGGGGIETRHSFADMDRDPVAVPIGLRGGNHLLHGRLGHPSKTAQGLAELGLLDAELMIVGNVLVGTAAASQKDRTGGGDTMRGRHDDFL